MQRDAAAALEVADDTAGCGAHDGGNNLRRTARIPSDRCPFRSRAPARERVQRIDFGQSFIKLRLVFNKNYAVAAVAERGLDHERKLTGARDIRLTRSKKRCLQ